MAGVAATDMMFRALCVVMRDAKDLPPTYEQVEAALAALNAAGWAVVPREPTEAIQHINGSANWTKMVEAMLAAARG